MDKRTDTGESSHRRSEDRRSKDGRSLDSRSKDNRSKDRRKGGRSVVIALGAIMAILASSTQDAAANAGLAQDFMLQQPPARSAAADSLTPSHSPPSYARWGRLAVERTISRYGTGISDYRYEGRLELGGGRSEERFKLVLDPHPGAPQAVLVIITVEGDALIGVKWKETRL